MRINDEITNKLTIVDSVSAYINNLKILQNEWCDDNWFMVYRGETEEYSTPCIPTIYRGFALKQNAHYETNMFMAMRQNNISSSDDYLHNAIDAQHDGFPSRLLDVTYNSLIALYFAVTPYYYKDEKDSDGKDGIVYVFKFDEAYSPEAKNTKDIYAKALEGDSNIYNASFLSHHHILIDHCKQNKRIIAQQGAFILFTGETPVPVPHYKMCGIRIAHNAKEKIRDELRFMFGIYTGSVYPEVELMQEEVKARCLRFNALSDDLGRATKAALNDLKEEYIYFADCCDYYAGGEKDAGELLRFIEKSVVGHKNHLKAYWEKLNNVSEDGAPKEEEKKKEIRNSIINQYNIILDELTLNMPKAIGDKIDAEVVGKMGGKESGEKK